MKPAVKNAPAPAAKKTAIAVRAATEVSTAIAANFEEDAGAGMAHVDADSVAIPFLAILQKNSPQCDPDAGEYIKEATPGMIFNTVTAELFNGKEGVRIVPCNYMRKFLKWKPRETGGGFQGELQIGELVKMREQGELVDLDNRSYIADANGNVNPKASIKVADTRIHYVMLLNPHTGMAQQAVLSLSSTQIKKSKQLNSLLGNVVMRRADSSPFTPPSFANVVVLQTVPESNEKGSWSGVRFELGGAVTDPSLYAAARAFSMLVDAGKAAVNYDAAAAAGADGEAGGERF